MGGQRKEERKKIRKKWKRRTKEGKYNSFLAKELLYSNVNNQNNKGICVLIGEKSNLWF